MAKVVRFLTLRLLENQTSAACDLETAAICFYAVIIQSVWIIWSCPSVASSVSRQRNALVERYGLH